MNQRIKALREHLNLKQKDFAARIGLKQAHLSKIEDGKGNVPTEALGKIIVAYNVDHLWLLGVTGEDQTPLFTEPAIPKSQLDTVVTKLHEAMEENRGLIDENRRIYRELTDLQKDKLNRILNPTVDTLSK